MNKKILASVLSGIFMAGTANAEFFSVIDKYEQDGGFVESPLVKLGYVYIEETDQDKTVELPLQTFGGMPLNGSVDYTISHIDTNDNDIVIDKGTLSVGLNQKNKIPVTIKGDNTLEPDESFRVTLSNPTLFRLEVGQEHFDYSIVDDDQPPTVSVYDVDVNEVNVDKYQSLYVELSEPAPQDFSIQYELTHGTTNNADLTLVSSTLNIQAGDTKKAISFILKGGTVHEEDETFNFRIFNSSDLVIDRDLATITIKDNDPHPSLSIADDSFMEGDVSEVKEYPIQMSSASSKDITVEATITKGTVDSDEIVEETKTVTILAGETEGIIDITVNGDYTLEDNETLNVEISNPTNATIVGQSTAVVTLDNDDTEYEFNTLPLYGNVEFYNNDTGAWEDVIANYGYERDVNFRYNPIESEVLKVSRDINIGSFDTDPSTPYYADGNHSLSDWGNVVGNKFTYVENGVTIQGTVASGNFSFSNSPGTATGVGLGSTNGAGELNSSTPVTITLDGDFLNDVQITADGLGGCYDWGNACETKVQITAYDVNNNVIGVQGGYRKPFDPTHGEAFIDTYNFTGQTTIKKFLVEVIGTNEGGNNPDLGGGANPLLNMTVSRSAFEVIDYKYTDIDRAETTERINLNINEGNANTNVDLNPYLLGQ